MRGALGSARPAHEGRVSAPACILVLGGSAEGFDVAEKLVARGYEVVTSFAGRTEERRTPAGRSRVGGFGGVEGLRRYIEAEGVAAVADALHPFAARMRANAAAACAALGVPLVRIERPVWTPEPGDDWRIVADMAEAARIAPATEGACFLTIGRQELAPFAARRDLSLLIRVIDLPETPFAHPRATFLRDRGPFGLEAERRLFAKRRIGCLVTKNSGAEASAAKLQVARELGLPVVMVQRPKAPEGLAAEGAEGLVEALARALGGQPRPIRNMRNS